MTFSVNTNPGALIALQNLNATQAQLQTTQDQISTGLSVATAADNGAIYAIAQNQRSQSLALDSVRQSLQRAQSTLDVATSAGSSISDLLNKLKATALSASDTSLDTNSRLALNSSFTSLRDQITKVVQNADFNGANLIKSGATDIFALANADGTSQLTIQAQSLALGGTIITLGATDSISSVTLAAAALGTINQDIVNVNNSLAQLGAAANAVQTHLTFIGDLQDTIDSGIGNLVNADLAKDSANLQALQTKQQLGVQALSIANSGSSALLSLFR
jgi:flagellin